MDMQTVDKVIRQIVQAEELVTELLDGSPEAASLWLDAPTDILFGLTPREAIVGGRGEAVIKWLEERLGK